MQVPVVRGRLCGLAAAAIAVLGCWVSQAGAFFPQSQPPFPPKGVEPLPPIIIHEPKPPTPPVRNTPEPGTMLLGLIGAGIAGAAARRRQKRNDQ